MADKRNEQLRETERLQKSISHQISRAAVRLEELVLLEQRLDSVNRNTYAIKTEINKVEAERAINVAKLALVSDELSEKERKYHEQIIKSAETEREQYDNRLKLNKATKRYITFLTGIQEKDETLVALMGGTGGMVHSMKAMKEAAKDMFTLSNITLSVWHKVFESTIAVVKSFDQAVANYNRLTGMADKDRGMLMDTAVGLREVGLGIDAAAASAGVMRTEFNDFYKLSKSSQSLLVATGAKFARIGVAVEILASNIDYLVKSLGYSVEEAVAMQFELREFGESIGFTSKQILTQFSKSMDSLAIYGRRGIKVFKELAIESKKTGIEIGNLAKLEKNFLTFDAATQLAQSMNAVARKMVIDPVNFMMASGKKKVGMLRDSLMKLKGQGIFLNPREMEMMAQATKMSVAEIQKLMDPKNNMDVQKQSVSEFSKVIKMSQTIGEQFLAIMKSFAIFAKPALIVFKKLLGALQFVFTLMDGTVPKLMFWGLTFIFVASKVMAVVQAMKAMQIVILALRAQAGLSLILMMAVAYGLQQLWKHGGVVGKIFAILVTAALLAAKAMGVLNLTMLANPFVLIAAAVAAVTYAIFHFREEIGAMLSALVGWAVNGVTFIMDKFYGLLSWIGGLGGEFFEAGANIAKSIADGIKSAILSPVSAIKSLVGKVRGFLPFSPAKEGPLSDLDKVGPGFTNTIAKGINPDTVIPAIQNMTQKMSYGVEASGIVGEKSFDGVQSIVSSSEKQGRNKAEQVAATKKVAEAMTAKKSGGESGVGVSGGEKQPLVFYLNEREFARAVLDIIESKSVNMEMA